MLGTDVLTQVVSLRRLLIGDGRGSKAWIGAGLRLTDPAGWG